MDQLRAFVHSKILNNIHAIMTEAGISQAELAKKLDWHQPQLSGYLSGKVQLPIGKLEAILAALDVELHSPPPPRSPTPEEMALAVFGALGLKGERGKLIELLLKHDDINFEFYLGVIEGSLTGNVPDSVDDKAKLPG